MSAMRPAMGRSIFSIFTQVPSRIAHQFDELNA